MTAIDPEQLSHGATVFMATKVAEQLTPMFDGEIWESDADVPMGKGYANDGKPFDIQTALYLRPAFQAIRNPAIRKVVIKAGVQTLKTFVVEKSTAFFARHDPGDMTFYDCDQEAAKDHAKSRVGPLLKSIPGLAAQFAEVEAGNRHDITTTEFYLPGMTLRFWPLNESSTQRITLRYVFISDAFLSKNTGMLKQAIARTTQHPLDKKIIIESQGSDEGDDFDREFSETDQGQCWVKCPHCGVPQEFVWDAARADGSYAGMKRGPDELVKLDDGTYNAQEILKETHYECLHCRAVWHDTPDVRAKLDASAHYVPANPSANPENIGLSWPAWINRRIKWGEIMLEYLLAKRSKEQFGNLDPLRQWYQKRAARTWSENLVAQSGHVMDSVYDPNAPMPDQAHIFGLIDVQEDGTHYWVDIWAVDKKANARLLDSAHVRATEENGQIVSAQKNVEKMLAKWKVPVNCVGCDFQHNPDDLVLKWAASNIYIGKIMDAQGRVKFGGRDGVLTWRLLSGNRAESFRWPDGRKKYFDYGYKGHGNRYPVTVNHQGRPFVVHIMHNNVATLHYADLAADYRDGRNGRKLEIMGKFAAEKGPESYNEQLHSEYRTTERNKPVWKKVTSNRPNHRWDNLKNLIVMMDIFGLRTYEFEPGDVPPPPKPDNKEEKTAGEIPNP